MSKALDGPAITTCVSSPSLSLSLSLSLWISAEVHLHIVRVAPSIADYVHDGQCSTLKGTGCEREGRWDQRRGWGGGKGRARYGGKGGGDDKRREGGKGGKGILYCTALSCTVPYLPE